MLVAHDEAAGSGALSTLAGLEGGGVACLVGGLEGLGGGAAVPLKGLTLRFLAGDPLHGAGAGVEEQQLGILLRGGEGVGIDAGLGGWPV